VSHGEAVTAHISSGGGVIERLALSRIAVVRPNRVGTICFSPLVRASFMAGQIPILLDDRFARLLIYRLPDAALARTRALGAYLHAGAMQQRPGHCSHRQPDWRAQRSLALSGQRGWLSDARNGLCRRRRVGCSVTCCGPFRTNGVASCRRLGGPSLRAEDPTYSLMTPFPEVASKSRVSRAIPKLSQPPSRDPIGGIDREHALERRPCLRD